MDSQRRDSVWRPACPRSEISTRKSSSAKPHACSLDGGHPSGAYVLAHTVSSWRAHTANVNSKAEYKSSRTWQPLLAPARFATQRSQHAMLRLAIHGQTPRSPTCLREFASGLRTTSPRTSNVSERLLLATGRHCDTSSQADLHEVSHRARSKWNCTGLATGSGGATRSTFVAAQLATGITNSDSSIRRNAFACARTRRQAYSVGSVAVATATFRAVGSLCCAGRIDISTFTARIITSVFVRLIYILLARFNRRVPRPNTLIQEPISTLRDLACIQAVVVIASIAVVALLAGFDLTISALDGNHAAALLALLFNARVAVGGIDASIEARAAATDSTRSRTRTLCMIGFRPRLALMPS